MIAADFLRFVLASGLGLVLDIALALALHDLAGLPLWLAATISFFAVALLNYLLFEFWIFARGRARFSLWRFGGVVAASSIAALVRIGAVLALEGSAPVAAAGRLADLLTLILAAGLSVSVNFVLNRFGVFASRHRGGLGQKER